MFPNVSAPLTTLKGQQAPLSFDLSESKRSTNGRDYFVHNSTIDVALLGCQGTDVYGFISMCNCGIQLCDHLQWIMVLLIHSGFSLTPKLCQGSCLEWLTSLWCTWCICCIGYGIFLVYPAPLYLNCSDSANCCCYLFWCTLLLVLILDCITGV